MSNLKSGMLTASLIASAAIALTPFSTFAGTDIFDDTVSTCTTTNCSSLSIPATIISPPGTGNSFTINVFAGVSECVRLDVTVAGGDLETTVIAPDGLVYRNDNKFPGANTPLVSIPYATKTGWYTVHISQANGENINASFILLYGRYPFGNPNCLAPTTPF